MRDVTGRELIERHKKNLTVKSVTDYIKNAFDTYAELREKFIDETKQSWYFKKGIGSKGAEFNEMRDRVIRIYRDLAENTEEDLQKSIETEENRLEELKSIVISSWISGMGLNAKIYSSLFKIGYNRYLKKIKTKSSSLESIDYYLENPDKFKQLMEL